MLDTTTHFTRQFAVAVAAAVVHLVVSCTAAAVAPCCCRPEIALHRTFSVRGFANPPLTTQGA